MAAIGKFLAFPERGLDLEVVHQVFRSGKGRTPVWRSRQHEHDAFSRLQTPHAMDHTARSDRPPAAGFLGDACDLRLGESGIMLQMYTCKK